MRDELSAARRFRDRVLGWCSSHPYWKNRRRVWELLLAALPVVLFALFALLVALNHRRWIPALRNAGAWLPVLVVVLAMSLSALITLALSDRWAELQKSGRVRAGTGDERAVRGPAVAFVALFLGATGPFILSTITLFPPVVRLLFNAFAILPMVAALVCIGRLSGASDERHRRRPIWLLGLLIALALVGTTLAYDLAVAYGNTELSQTLKKWIPLYPQIETRFTGLVVFLPIAFSMYALWELWRQAVPATKSLSSGAEQEDSESKSLWDRVVGWVRWLFGLGEEAPEEPGRIRPPGWLAGLLKNLPDNCRRDGKVKRIENPNPSDYADRADLEVLFGGVSPTESQASLFDRFVESYEEVLGAEGAGFSGEEEEPCADILVEGEPGSGRTTVLFACAVYAAFVRGQRVLLLLPNKVRQVAFKERFDRFLSDLRLHHYVRTRRVTPENVDRWIENEDAVLPHVFFATPQSLENHLYGAPHARPEHMERLRRLLTMVEVILIDDFMDFGPAERAHLPFLLDKHRLLLQAEYVPMQTVVTGPKLSEKGRMLLGKRLFTDKRLDLRRNCVALRPRPGGRAWRLDLVAGDVPTALNRLVVHSLRRDLQVVLFQKGIDQRERDRLEKKLTEEGGGGTLTVLTDLNETFAGSDEVDVVFYQVATRSDICLGLRTRMGHEDTVIVSVSPEGQLREDADYRVIPVVVDRSAASMLVPHTDSMLRFLRPRTPVPEEPWLRFGVRYDDLEAAWPQQAPDILFDYDRWREEDYALKIWPYAALRGNFPGHHEVDVRALPHETRRFYRHEGGHYFFVGRPAGQDQTEELTERDAPCLVTWRDEAGSVLRRSDLRHMREFKLTWGSRVYVPGDIRVGEEVEFTGQRWSGHEPYLPVLRYTCDLPEGQEAEEIHGGRDYGLCWNRLEPTRPEPVRLSAGVEALMTEYGFETPIETLEFSYPTLVSDIILNPAELDSDNLRSEVGRALSGRWRTGGEAFSPALTTALTYALEARVPGLGYFARCLAFRCRGRAAAVGSAAVFFYEPRSCGHTIWPIIDALMDDPETRLSFFRSVRWFLHQLQNSPDPRTFARRFCRMGFEGDRRLSDVSDSLELVEAVIGRTEFQLGMIQQYSPLEPPESPRPDTAPSATDPKTDPEQWADWDVDSEVTPWEECFAGLWEQALQRFEGLDEIVLPGWEHNCAVLVRCPGSGGADWSRSTDAAEGIDGLEAGELEGMLLGVPAGGVTGAGFRDAVIALLSTGVGSEPFEAGRTLAIQLWILPEGESSAERLPALRDPLNTTLEGGFTPDGLAVTTRPNPLPPERVPEVAPYAEEGVDRLEAEPQFTPPDRADSLAGEWTQALPAPPEIDGAAGNTFRWRFRGKSYRLLWGFDSEADGKRYLRMLDALEARISNKSFPGYILNDPYLGAVHELADELLRLYGGEVDYSFAEYLLAFVQSFPYLSDPDRPTDWPRFPSEFLAHFGGDCEDSSIMLACLLARFGFETAFLQMAGHLAVGIAGPYGGFYYEREGVKYYYAETATAGSYKPLGSQSELAGPAEVLPYPGNRVPGQSPVQIISARMPDNTSTLRCTAASRLEGNKPVCFAVYARPAGDMYDSASSPALIGAGELPPQDEPGQIVGFSMDLDQDGLSGQNFYDVVAWSGDTMQARWIAALSMYFA